MGFTSAEEYEKAAARVPNNPAVLHKTEKEDGDDVYYVEATNEHGDLYTFRVRNFASAPLSLSEL